MSHPTRYRHRRHHRPHLTVSKLGIPAFAVARVADTVVTAPLLLAYPAGEANPVARAIAETFGVGGYVAASLLAIPLCVILIEWLVHVDRPRGSHRPWAVPVVKALAYTLLTAASAAAAVHNVHALTTVLGVVFA